MHHPHAALRILDANLNRAREGLRTAEEFARLSLSDAPRALTLKHLRHNLDQLFRAPEIHHALLAARNVAHDVGAGATLAQQSASRANGLTPADVARAAFKRTAEALRNLEEYLPTATATTKAETVRLPKPAAVAAIRYALYDLERDLFLTAARANLLAGRVLCLLWSPDLYRVAAAQALTAARAGARDAGRPDSLLIQLRVKNHDDRPLLKLAMATRRLCEKLALPLILNDRADLAHLSGCHGVHLGQTDLTPAQARETMGPNAVIGLSTHSAAQITAAIREPIDYIGLGPMFATQTKPELHPQGPMLAKSTKAARRAFNKPVFAIGGISAKNLPLLRAQGIRAAAASGAVFGSANPAEIRRAVAAILRVL